MEKAQANQKFGSFIKSLRKENNMTQLDLSIKIQNNFQNISSLERGEFSPSLHYLHNLASAFDLSLTEFIARYEDFAQGT